MANLFEDIQCTGSDTRPPMLDRTDFVSWHQQIRLYCRGKENGVNILKSIDEGPFQMGTFRETLAEGNEGALHLGPEQPRVYSDLSPEDKDRWEHFGKLLQKEMKDIWDNVKMLLEGSELTKEDRESQLYDDFEHFRQHKGETIHDYYVQFVTAVKLNRGLRDSNYDQLYAYLKQHEAHANENKMMLDRFTQHTVDPLALMSNVAPQQYNSQSSTNPSSTYVPPHFADNSQLDSGLSPTDNLIENLTNTLALLTQSYKTYLPQTNNQLRTSSNPRNQATVQDGRVVVQNVQGRQNRGQGSNAQGAGTAGYGGAQNRVGNANPGHARQVKCYNCNGGHDNTVDEDVDEQPVQDLALNVDNMFQDDDCDAFDFDVDEASMAQTMFMANLSSADPVYDGADAVCKHHKEHEMHDDVQLNYVVDSHADYTSNSNMIPYDQYVKDNAVPVVQRNVSSVTHDAYMMIYNDMCEAHAQRASFELTEREQKIDEQLRIVIIDRNIKEENLKNELHSVKLQLASTINHTKSMVKIAPPDYSKENYLVTFTPQKQLTPDQIFWSRDIIKMKAEALKEQTTASRPTKALTVYPLNTLATLVPRVLLTKSQVKINIFALIQLFLDFKKTCNKRITPTGLTEGERGFEQTKACYLTEVIPFFKTLKEHLRHSNKALIKEVKEMKEIFEELEAEVDQHVVDRKHDEIERKNLLIANDNLISDCLFKDVFHVATNSDLNVSSFTEMYDAHTSLKARCLELEGELSNLRDKIQMDNHDELIKWFSNLEVNHLNLQLKYQNLKESFGNNTSPPTRDVPDFDSVFVIKKMKASIQGKDNAIKKLRMTLDFQITQLTEKINVLQEQNELFRTENGKIKQHYKELYDSIKITRATHLEQTTALLTKNESLKVQIQNKLSCVNKDHVKPKVLEPGKYAIVVEPIPPRNRNNREVHLVYLKHLKESVETLREIELLEYVIGTCLKALNTRDNKHASTSLPKKKQVTFEEQCAMSKSNTHKPVEQLNCQKTNVPVPPSTGVNSFTDASRSQPRSNTKKNRILPAKSVNMKKVEEHHRTIKSSLKTTNRVDSSISSKHTVINSNSHSVCQTCNKCLISANHDMCVVTYFHYVNASPSVKNVVRKVKQVWKPKQVKQVWKPTGNILTTVGYQWMPTGRTFTLGEQCPLTRLTKPNKVLVVQIVLWYLDSGCSKHMTGDRSRLRNFVKKFIGTVRFGNDHFGAIMGYGDYVIGESVISRVYYVEGLGHNLFSVGQFCDSDLEVAFRKHSCYVRDTDGVELIKGSRGSNLYTISIEDMLKSSPICLLSKASKNKSWLWHRRLNHLNFGTINDLARKDLVRGLPRLKFEKDHLCSACQLGKSKKHTHKPKTENTNLEVLNTLHMDLCGPMRVQTINGNKYILVIVDDYSRLNKNVRNIHTDNGTDFVNTDLTDYYERVGIFHQKTVLRTPQQNGVVKRRNRTLVEAARTMLIFSKAPIFLWAESMATACYTQNRSLIHTRHCNTSYELVHDKKPDLTFFKVFGALCYPTNDSEDLGKLQPTADIGIFVGYAPSRKGSIGNGDRMARSYNTQEESAESSNVQKETGNVQRALQTSSSGNDKNVQCYNCSAKGHYAQDCPKPRVRGFTSTS
ncbi:retrovirus-related pol polyprotein from transposon TNT 1-94 [Tanacetum coccineum]|uniref:Retrovirus-related pol polyprotein from transposon TNT 1-94 n=1 Tax=Tanacetum coccineum TaxID=301880 RepID=A0ABQ4Y4N6_9ASTR